MQLRDQMSKEIQDKIRGTQVLLTTPRKSIKNFKLNKTKNNKRKH